MTDELDPATLRLLAEYIRAGAPADGESEPWRGARAELRALGKQFTELQTELRSHVKVCDDRWIAHVRLESRHDALAKAVEDMQVAEEVTGVQNLADLKSQHKELRKEIARRDARDDERSRAWRKWTMRTVGVLAAAVASWLTRGAMTPPAPVVPSGYYASPGGHGGTEGQ